MRRNLDELPASSAWLAAFDAEQLFVQHLCHDFGEATLPGGVRAHARLRGRARRCSTRCRSESTRRSARRDGWRPNSGVDLRLPRTRPRAHPAGTPGRERCDWPWRGAYVSYQGLAMPCCMISTPDRLNFGSVVESGMQAVWNGEGYDAFRRALDSDEPPAICRSCAVYNGTF